MTAEQRYWDRLRSRAQACLPEGFARRTILLAQNRNKSNRREYVLMTITAALCLASVAAANWYFGDLIQERNLTQWGVAESQVSALRTSL